MSFNMNKTPFPWFGGKADAAEAVWAAIGDVPHYVEPFAGSLAVLLRRPHVPNRTYFSETVNDMDGLLCNAWRSIALSPGATAEAASWPVSEADLHARHLALVKWRAENNLELLMGSPEWHDPKMAGWWMWGVSCWIGSGFCSGKGPWVAGPDGRFTRSDEGKVNKKLPHLGNDGRGVNHPSMKEEGVSRKLPDLVGNGRGVNHASMREEGLYPEPFDYHPVTMPRLREWFAYLSARLRHVRILNGDWQRALTGGASKTLPVRQGNGPCGVFLDPPYSDTANRAGNLYNHDCLQVAHAVRAWALKNGSDPEYRIVVAGFEGEHNELEAHGWRKVEWFKSGFLKGGMGNQNKDGHQQGKERLWLSPHCLGAAKSRQPSLFQVNG